MSDKKVNFQRANENDFLSVRQFYWNVIDDIHKNNINNENLGWEKGVYPSDAFLADSIRNNELYMLTDGDTLCACVIINSKCNEGYNGCMWSVSCEPDEVLIPHALAVNPCLQRKGIGKIVVKHIIDLAKSERKKAVRLDVLGACKAAERLYVSCGFRFVEAKDMYYDDTGLTEYKMFELGL